MGSYFEVLTLWVQKSQDGFDWWWNGLSRSDGEPRRFAKGLVKGTGRVTVMAAALALAAVTLTGCGAKDRVSARLVDGDIEFVMCSPIDFNEVLVKAVEDGTAPSKTGAAWLVKGPLQTDVSRVTYGAPPVGMQNIAGPDSFQLTKGFLQIEFVMVEKGQVVEARQATFDTDSLSEEAWLTAGGQLEEQPCPRT